MTNTEKNSFGAASGTNAVEPRSMLLRFFFGLSIVSLVTSVSLLAGAVYIH